MRVTFLVHDHERNAIELMPWKLLGLNKREGNEGFDLEFEAALRAYDEANRLPKSEDSGYYEFVNEKLGPSARFSLVGTLTIQNNRIVWAKLGRGQ